MTEGTDAHPIDTRGGAFIQEGVYVQGGDFVGRDQYNYHVKVQFVVLGTAGEQAAQAPRAPYLAERSFGLNDHALFTGRDVEIASVLQRVRDPHDRSTVIYGAPAVGKSSFLWAGVVPRLTESGDEIVIPVLDYGEGVATLRAPLTALALQLHLTLPEDPALPQLLRRITAGTGRPLVLVLDQFEGFFAPSVSAATRRVWLETLAEFYRSLDPAAFHLLIALSPAWHTALDRTWGTTLPDLRTAPVHLAPFDYTQARTAVLHPPRALGVQPIFDPAFVDQQLLPDLDRLSSPAEQIMPGDVQIVCHHLYERARADGAQSITTSLYFQITDHQGAERILNRRFGNLLDRVSSAHRTLARTLAIELLAQAENGALQPSQFPLTPEERAHLSPTLEEMTRLGLLTWHLTDERERTYTFANASVAGAAERALERTAQDRLRARREAVYIWRAWVAYARLADAHQLDVLARHPPQHFPVEQILVALRSAVVARTSVQPWLQQLTAKAARTTVRALEETETEGPTVPATPHRQIAKILGLNAQEADTPLPPTPPGFGPVAWTAASAVRPTVRETATLALASAYDADAIPRLEAAVATAERTPQQQRRRLSELFGMLLDARPELEGALRERGRGAWLAARGWRFQRHLKRHWDYVLLLMLSGSVTAALSVALLRLGLSAWVSRVTAGEAFYGSLLHVALLSAALILGLLLTDLARVNAATSPTDAVSSRPLGPALIAATLLFLLTYGGLAALASTRYPLVWALSLPVAVALSWAVADHPRATWGCDRRLLSDLGAPVAVAALVQALFESNPTLGASLIYTWPGYFYDRLPPPLWLWGVGDAALQTLVMTGGLTLGLYWADERYRRRYKHEEDKR
ncbi:MAG: hypothetical protein ACP5HM_10655 [Anaerolineae bacterium]